MYESKLISRLKYLDARAVRRFGAFVESPYFNKDKNVIQLWQYIAPHRPAFTHKALAQPSVLEALYASADRVEELRRNQSDLVKLLDKFLALEAMSDLQSEKLLLDAYEARGMTEEFQKQGEKLVQSLAAETIPTPESLRLSADVQQQLFFQPATEKYTPQAPYLYGAMEQLDQYYWLSKFRLTAELLHRRRIYSEADRPDLPGMVSDLPAYCTAKVFQLYIQLFKLLQSKEPHPEFDALLTDIETHIAALDSIDKRHLIGKMYYIANNYYEKGQTDYVKHMFRVVKLAEREKLLTFQNTISHLLFINFVTVAAMAEDFGWARNHVETYAPFVATEYRNDAVNLARAHLHFYQNKHQDALQCISDVSKVHPGLRVHAETLCLRIYCALIAGGTDCEADFYRCKDRFTKYLRAKATLSKEKVTAIQSFMNITEQLVHYHLSPSSERKQRKADIEQLFKATPGVYSAYWLSRQIEQL
ncbi:MAG: hypothetical protein KF852_04715 [Saprospiraceae bacterium]|nr:hypothetical protein [Saprospiraceae bacterium]